MGVSPRFLTHEREHLASAVKYARPPCHCSRFRRTILSLADTLHLQPLSEPGMGDGCVYGCIPARPVRLAFETLLWVLRLITAVIVSFFIEPFRRQSHGPFSSHTIRPTGGRRDDLKRAKRY